MNTTRLYLSEALSGFYASSHPRLRSLRSLSLGLLKVCLSEALIEDMLLYTPGFARLAWGVDDSRVFTQSLGEVQTRSVHQKGYKNYMYFSL